MKDNKKHTNKKSTTVRSKPQLILKNLLKGVSHLNPKWGADLGLILFSTPLKRRKAKALPAGTRSITKKVNGQKIKVYQYGNSVQRVLLVHGWEGAATDFTHFFEPLSAAGFEVITIDLPGHGKSSFGRLDAIKTAKIVDKLEDQLGPFSAFVGHSFGAFSLGHALARFPKFAGIPFVSIGSPTKLKIVIREFSNFVGFTPLQRGYLNTKIEKNFNIRIHDFEQGKFMSGHQGPLLVIHDRNDKMVPVDRIEHIKEQTLSPTFLITEGLGHNRILRDQFVVNKVKEFIKQFKNTREGIENSIRYGLT